MRRASFDPNAAARALRDACGTTPSNSQNANGMTSLRGAGVEAFFWASAQRNRKPCNEASIMTFNQILLIIIGVTMVGGMLYLFLRVLLQPAPKPDEPATKSKDKAGTGAAHKTKA